MYSTRARRVLSNVARRIFYVNEAKQNSHAFADKNEELTRLIYNDVPKGGLGDSYRAYIYPPA